MDILNEILAQGGGIRRLWTSLDSFFIRTMAYTTARVWAFLSFYDYLNPDPRRILRGDKYIFAGLGGGMVAGLLTNPIDLVFARQQVDELYPEQCRRNYKNFMDGLMKAADEGVLLRGGVANGARIAALCFSMSTVYDFLKENAYYFMGPTFWTRIWCTAAAGLVGTAASMPFDTIRVRMHTMRPLPDGSLPYLSSYDCFKKMLFYEGNSKYHGNFGCFFSGGQPYALRLIAICLVSQYILDYYHDGSFVSEFWQPARYNYHGGIDYDIHEPFTDGFNKYMMSQYSNVGGDPAYSPDGESSLKIV